MPGTDSESDVEKTTSNPRKRAAKQQLQPSRASSRIKDQRSSLEARLPVHSDTPRPPDRRRNKQPSSYESVYEKRFGSDSSRPSSREDNSGNGRRRGKDKSSNITVSGNFSAEMSVSDLLSKVGGEVEMSKILGENTASESDLLSKESSTSVEVSNSVSNKGISMPVDQWCGVNSANSTVEENKLKLEGMTPRNRSRSVEKAEEAGLKKPDGNSNNSTDTGVKKSSKEGETSAAQTVKAPMKTDPKKIGKNVTKEPGAIDNSNKLREAEKAVSIPEKVGDKPKQKRGRDPTTKQGLGEKEKCEPVAQKPREPSLTMRFTKEGDVVTSEFVEGAWGTQPSVPTTGKEVQDLTESLKTSRNESRNSTGSSNTSSNASEKSWDSCNSYCTNGSRKRDIIPGTANEKIREKAEKSGKPVLLEEIRLLRNRVIKLEMKVQQVRSDRDLLVSYKRDLDEKIVDLSAKAETAEDLETEVENLKKVNESLEKDWKETQKIVSENPNVESVCKMTTDMNKLRQELQTTEDRVKRRDELVQKWTSYANGLKKQLDNPDVELRKWQSKANSMEVEFNGASRKLRSIESENAECHGKIFVLQEQAQVLQKQLSETQWPELQKKLESAQQEVDVQFKAVKNCQNRIGELEKALRDKSDKCSIAEYSDRVKEFANMKQMYDTAVADAKDFFDKLSEAKQYIEELETGRMSKYLEKHKEKIEQVSAEREKKHKKELDQKLKDAEAERRTEFDEFKLKEKKKFEEDFEKFKLEKRRIFVNEFETEWDNKVAQIRDIVLKEHEEQFERDRQEWKVRADEIDALMTKKKQELYDRIQVEYIDRRDRHEALLKKTDRELLDMVNRRNWEFDKLDELEKQRLALTQEVEELKRVVEKTSGEPTKAAQKDPSTRNSRVKERSPSAESSTRTIRGICSPISPEKLAPPTGDDFFGIRGLAMKDACEETYALAKRNPKKQTNPGEGSVRVSPPPSYKSRDNESTMNASPGAGQLYEGSDISSIYERSEPPSPPSPPNSQPDITKYTVGMVLVETPEQAAERMRRVNEIARGMSRPPAGQPRPPRSVASSRGSERVVEQTGQVPARVNEWVQRTVTGNRPNLALGETMSQMANRGELPQRRDQRNERSPSMLPNGGDGRATSRYPTLDRTIIIPESVDGRGSVRQQTQRGPGSVHSVAAAVARVSAERGFQRNGRTDRDQTIVQEPPVTVARDPPVEQVVPRGSIRNGQNRTVNFEPLAQGTMVSKTKAKKLLEQMERISDVSDDDSDDANDIIFRTDYEMVNEVMLKKVSDKVIDEMNCGSRLWVEKGHKPAVVPATFMGGADEQVQIWVRDFKVKALANNWTDEHIKQVHFMNYLGGEAYEWYLKLQKLPEFPALRSEQILALMRDYFYRENDMMVAEGELKRIRWQPLEETSAEYMARLRKIAKIADRNMKQHRLIQHARDGCQNLEIYGSLTAKAYATTKELEADMETWRTCAFLPTKEKLGVMHALSSQRKRNWE